MKKSTKEKVEQTPHTTGIQRIVLTNKTTYTTNLAIIQKEHLKRGYCVLAPILNPNYDFIPIFFYFVFLPLLFQNKGSVYPYSMNSR